MALNQLYGLSGFMGSGKNTAAALLIDAARDSGYADDILYTHSFAGVLKDVCAVLYGWDRALLEGDTPASRVWREKPDPYWSKVFNRPYTPRTALQEIGTNVFRNYQSNIWIAAIEQRTSVPGMHILTDARFENELSWIRERESGRGLTLWIYRPEPQHYDGPTRDQLTHLIANATHLDVSQPGLSWIHALPGHASETSFLKSGQLLDIVVENSYGLAELRLLIKHLWSLQGTGQLAMLPVGTRTLYLSYDLANFTHGPFVWRYQLPNGFVRTFRYTQAGEPAVIH